MLNDNSCSINFTRRDFFAASAESALVLPQAVSTGLLAEVRPSSGNWDSRW